MPEPLTIRWDESMGCYRVNRSNFAEDGPVRVFTEEEVRSLVEWADGLVPFIGGRLGAAKTMEIRQGLQDALDTLSAPKEWSTNVFRHRR